MIRKITGFIFLFAIITTGCSRNDSLDIKRIQTENIFHLFPDENLNAASFCVDKKDNVYYSLSNIENDTINTIIKYYDKDGNLKDNFAIENGINLENLVYYNDFIYYTYFKYINGFETQVIDRYNLILKETEEVLILDNISKIKRITEINGNLYILGNSGEKKIEIGLNEYNYSYNGEVILTYNIETDTLTEISNIFPIAISNTLDNKLMIYHYDEDEGYCFSEYNPINLSIIKKSVYNIRNLLYFEMLSETEFISREPEIITRTIIGNINSHDSVLELFDNIYLTDGFILNGEYIYFIDVENNHKLKRVNIQNQLLFKEFGTIDIVSAETIIETPSSLGFYVNRQNIGYDNFALKVLSLDSDYDICVINSRQIFAASIREKESFYPLNNIDGVNEYIDSCFPFIKESAVNKNGDIWMIPFYVNSVNFAYNKDLCDSLGIAFAEKLSVEQFADKVISIYNNGENNIAYDSGSTYYLCENFLSQYIYANKKFNTDIFYNLAQVIKNKIYTNPDAFSVSKKGLESYYTGDYSEIAFGRARDIYTHSLYTADNSFAAPFPYVEGNDKILADCIFLSVNPASENLNGALQYIAQLVYELKNDKNNLMIADNPIYNSNNYFKSLKDVYTNSVIRFSVNSEIYFNEFIKYINNETTLENFIAEADRKLDLFYNE